MLNRQACHLDDAYLPKSDQVVDIRPFQSVDITSAKKNMCCASRVGEELKANSILDETQVQAVDLVLRKRLAIIQVIPFMYCEYGASNSFYTFCSTSALCLYVSSISLIFYIRNSHRYVRYHLVSIHIVRICICQQILLDQYNNVTCVSTTILILVTRNAIVLIDCE